MKSKEQNELNKQNRNRLKRVGLWLWRGRLGVGVERYSKKEKGLMDMDNSVVIAGAGGWVEVEEGIKRVNGNGKKPIKMK